MSDTKPFVLNLNATIGMPYLRTPSIQIEEDEDRKIWITLTCHQAMVDRQGNVQPLGGRPIRVGPVALTDLPLTMPWTDIATGEPVPGREVRKDALFAQIVSVAHYLERLHLAPPAPTEPATPPAGE